MLLKSRLPDLLLIVMLVALVASISHFVITNPLGPSRIFYYLEAPIIQWATRCSSSAPEWMAKVQRYATRNMGAPASQLAYVTPGGSLHHCETGWADGIFGDRPLQPDTRFRFASTTKTVTAIAVVDLVNEKKLALNDRIVELLDVKRPLKDPRVGEITVEQLLSHRAGWDRQRTQDVMFLSSTDPWCPAHPEQLAETRLMYSPGEKEVYSNIGYCLLGLVIESVTGKPFREYISSRFDFDSSSLAFIDGPYLPDEVSYDLRFENFYTSSYYKAFNFKALSSSAGLSGSASDLALLTKNSLQSNPLSIRDGDVGGGCDSATIKQCYGFGVYRYQPESNRLPIYVHGGKLPGAHSVVMIDPNEGVVVWAGAGSPRPGSGALQDFYDEIGDALANYYATTTSPPSTKLR